MSVSRVIEVSFGGGSIAYAKVDTAYFYNNGIIFKPTDIDLPASYQVHWADSPQASSTLETIGTSEGAPIPDDLWNRSRVIYGWIYLHPTNDSSITGYEVRIYKNVRAGLPDGTEPTPAEQSTIDQLISALNSAVDQTGEDVESAEQSARSAESAKTAAESARDTAGEYANDAESSAASASTSASQASTSATASAESAEQAAQIKMDVEALADDAQGYAESASQSASASAQSASASANSASDAQGYANSASASAQSASGYASSAQTSAQTASAKAQDASTSAQTASNKASEASQSASQALTYKTDAESAKTASQTAQGLAESARDSAISAKTDAESAKDDAESARDEAQQAVASISGALAEKAPVITDTASGSIASFSDGADDLPLKSLVVDINPIQDLSNGDPSPENICPISGWTSVDVEQSGVNVWDEEWKNGYYNTNGEFVSSENYVCSKNLIPLCGQNSYYLKFPVIMTLSLYDGNKNYIGRANGTWKDEVLRHVHYGDAKYMHFASAASGALTTYNHDISINYPSTDHSYHPYTGRSIVIQLGQTVYGGKLDVLSGELVIDRAMVDLGSKTFTKWVNDNNTFASVVDGISTTNQNITCDTYAPLINGETVWAAILSYDMTIYHPLNGMYLLIRDTRYTDVTAFNTAMSGVQLVYPLATPLEIQLDAHAINSLYGVNNLWADSGDAEAVYRADTKAYIAKKIAEAIASLT